MAFDPEKLRGRLKNIAGDKTDAIVERVENAYNSGAKGDLLEKELQDALNEAGMRDEAEIIDISMMTRIEGV